MNATATIVSKVWSFCTTLRDDGVGYGDYLEQLTYLIFLKMADEYSQPPYNRKVGIPAEYDWQSLKTKRGAELEVHYVTLLRELGNKPGMLGQIFTKAQNKTQDPAKLYRLIDMVNETQWVTMGADVKGDIYEGLLERNVEDTKSGAGQYFTPRALIRAMVECVRPEPLKTIADYNPDNRHKRKDTWDEATNPEGRWRKFSYEQIIVRDKTSLDIFWLKDKSLADLDNLPEPDVLALEIVDNLEAGLNSFRAISAAL
jgi:hypothetical protein